VTTTADTALTPIPVAKPWIGQEEIDAVGEAMRTGWVAQGPRVAEFERAVADRLQAAHGVATTSCTTALQLALIVGGIGAGDEVIVPSLSFIATANVVVHVGATPIFADVDADTLNLTVDTIAPLIGPRTRAIILVDQVGTPADVHAVRALCDAHGLLLVEDAACAIGSTYAGTPIGSHSDLVALSFHPRKVITTGEGGMLLTSRDDWAQRARRLREHGMSMSAAERHASGVATVETYDEVGYNFRMTDLQAAMGLVQLGRLDEIVAERRRIAARYTELLAGAPQLARVASDPSYEATTNFQSYWIELSDGSRTSRDDVLAGLADAGIGARRGIMAAHTEGAYAGTEHVPLPVTERMTDHSLILPIFHGMSDAQQDYVVARLLDLTS
jgi:dTDP-4-amino-4,6-dideoxygalactose transaminase